MSISFATIGKMYSSYANANLPWNDLHAYAAKLATSPTEQAPLLPLTNALVPTTSAQQGRARAYAYRAAVVPHHIMRLPDAIFGTGVNPRNKPVDIRNGNDVIAHVSACIRSPFDSGWVGLAQGQFLLRSLSNGAFVGALLGAMVCAKPETIDTCAATGAVVSAALFWLAPALCVSILNGAFRVGTSLAKFAVVGAFYAAGYVVGSLVDQLAKEQAFAAA